MKNYAQQKPFASYRISIENIKEKVMKRKPKIIACTIGGISFIALLVAVIMWLWNLVVPTITG